MKPTQITKGEKLFIVKINSSNNHNTYMTHIKSIQEISSKKTKNFLTIVNEHNILLVVHLEKYFW